QNVTVRQESSSVIGTWDQTSGGQVLKPLRFRVKQLSDVHRFSVNTDSTEDEDVSIGKSRCRMPGAGMLQASGQSGRDVGLLIPDYSAGRWFRGDTAFSSDHEPTPVGKKRGGLAIRDLSWMVSNDYCRIFPRGAQYQR